MLRSNLGAIKMFLPILEWHFTVLMRYNQCLKPSLIRQPPKIWPEFSSMLAKFNWQNRKSHHSHSEHVCHVLCVGPCMYWGQVIEHQCIRLLLRYLIRVLSHVKKTKDSSGILPCFIYVCVHDSSISHACSAYGTWSCSVMACSTHQQSLWFLIRRVSTVAEMKRNKQK